MTAAPVSLRATRPWAGWRGLLFGVCALVGGTGVHAADNGRQLFRDYSESDGLHNLVVRQMLQTRDGQLWVGTENGLYRYGGFRFEKSAATDGLHDPVITGLAEDGDGRLWVSSGDEVRVRVPGQHWRTALRTEAIAPGALATAADGGIHARTDAGLLHLSLAADGQIATRAIAAVAPSPADADTEAVQRPLHVEPDGSLWTGCDTALCRIDASGALRRFGVEDGVPADRWLAWHRDAAGRLWVRSRARLLMRADASAPFTSVALPDYAITSERRDPALGSTGDGKLITSGKSGLAEFDGTQWVHYSESDGLPSHPITAILTDSEGSLWLGTFGHGLFRALGFGAWRHWTINEGLPSGLVWGAVRDGDGDVWVATEDGLAVIPAGAQAMRAPQAPASGAVGQAFAVAVDARRRAWLAARDGRLLRLDDAQRPPPTWDTGLRALRMSRGPGDTMWLLAEEGAYSFDASAAVPKPVALPGSDIIERPRDIAEGRDGRRWITGRNGLFVGDAHGWRALTTRDGAALDHFITLAVDDDGHVWIGSFGRGLWQLDVSGDGPARVLQRIGPETLGTQSVLFVRRDVRGWLWVGTDVGVAMYDGHQWHRLDRADGLLWNDCDEGAFWADDDGSVWIGTSAGLSHFLRPELVTNPPEPTLILRSLRFGERSLLDAPDATLPWQRADLSFELATSSFSVERSLELRYRLRELEDEWQVAQTPTVRYAALPAGRYTLELQAANPSRGQLGELRRVQFAITPPLWQTPFVYLLGLGAVALTVVAFVQLRLRVVLRRSRQLERLVAERTAELESDKIVLLRTREALMERATRDALTGLWNRGVILDQLDQSIARAHEHGGSVAVVLIDVDHFKQINDRHGHLVGDEVLRVLARRLAGQLLPGEELGRYGGEEFLLVLGDLPLAVPSARIEALHAGIGADPITIDGDPLVVTASFGVAWFIDEPGGADALLRRADRALYDAKAAGRARVRYATRAAATALP